MRYMLLIHYDEQEWQAMSPEQKAEVYAGYGRLSADPPGTATIVTGAEFQPTASAVTVRVRDGQGRESVGPYAVAAEQLGGFMLIDCESDADAVAFASCIPCAARGGVEVRPLSA